MRGLPNNSVDAVVTDPPYGFAFMGKKWDYNLPPVELWEQALRVLKPGGHLLAFGGARTYHRATCRIEDAGFEIRDCVMWVYGSGFPKSHNLQGEWKGFGTALKPAHEPIVLARKPLIGTVAENVQAWGCGALNVDGCRIETGHEVTGRPQYESKGWKNTSGMTGSVTDDWKKGRWPANLIHDGSDEVVGMFPQTTSGNLRPYKERHINASSFKMSRDKDYSKDGDTGSAARFFYAAKASRSEREAGLDGMPEARGGAEQFDSRWKEGTGDARKPMVRNSHPTVKPQSLMRYLCRLITPPDGIILDPFFGSGSTGVAAIAEGFSIIGIEREAEYVEIARRRCAHALGADAPLFAVA